jgi:hypothetical protein
MNVVHGSVSIARQFGLAMLTIFTSLLVYAAPESYRIDVKLEWAAAPIELGNGDGFEARTIPTFTGATYENINGTFFPVFATQVPGSVAGEVNILIENAVYEPYDWPGRRLPEAIGQDLNFQSVTGYEKGRPKVMVSFIPLRRNPSTGATERLVSGTLIVNIQPSATRISGTEDHTYADNSVLSSGTWYKISVAQTGVFKVDKALLESIGINTSTLNPLTLGIFGNGGGMLPESNSIDNPDDLIENALYRVGLADGSFDDGDYVLFYGEGPHQWSFDTIDTTFSHTTHIYANRTSYFITPDRGSNLSLATQPVTADAPTYTSTSFDHLQVWDFDDLNLIRSGRQFFDYGFTNFSNNRGYAIDIPGIITSEPARIEYFIAAKSSAGSSTFNVSGSGLNNTTILPLTIESTENDYATYQRVVSEFNPTSSSSISLDFLFSGPSGSTGWLDDIEIVLRRQLDYAGGQMRFRDTKSLGQTTLFQMDGPEDVIIWDVTDATRPLIQAFYYPAGQIEFTLHTDSLKEFIAFYTSDAFSSDAITFEGVVNNQNVHNSALQPDLVIVSYPDYIGEARRLAAWHHNVNGYDTLVVSVGQVYNEFSSGTPDITAIRNMMRMFYDRAGGVEDAMPQYLLLVGDASFDYKSIMTPEADNTNRVPTFQSYQSINQVGTYPTDDYYACLDEMEGGNMDLATNLLDIGVGRLPVNSVSEARDVVDKIIHYKSTETLGNWRNAICFVADDEDGNIHIDDANDIADWIQLNHPLYNINKIYLDAYQQVPGAGGERYPDVNRDINNQMFTGALLLNWTGHGNEQNWAQERILGVDDINSWTNFDKLPLFITATCSFSRYDNPERTSAGELILLNPQGGGIGLVTTVRIVYSFQNYILNSNFFYTVFEPVDGVMPTIGDALVTGKNNASTGFQAVNNRKFLLLGDPALRLNYAQYDVVTTQVNDIPIADGTDTLSALAKVTITGEVRQDGVKLSSFNGVVYPTVYDKPVNVTTLENDPEGSNPYTYSSQKSAIYKGKASVVNGEFSFEFIVPKDISYTFGNGKLSYYADNGMEDAAGYEFNVVVGGAADGALTDTEGPDVAVYMNDETFVFGGITDENPFLFIQLEDENGINTVGNGIGHDIVASINEDESSFKLNDYYEADLDSYQSGTVRYPLYDLPAGRHAVSVSAWDVYNNSGDGYTEFVVAESADLALDHVLNYPNPFTTQTEFWFEHNRPGDVLDVKVEIFSVSGKLVKTIQTQASTGGYRVDGITWDGLDNFGDPIGRGVYVYKVSVKALSDNSRASEFEKLVILR